MSGDERRYVPPDPPTATGFTAPVADPGATDPDPPAASDDPGGSPNDTVPDVPEPEKPARREEPDPEDVRVAPLPAHPAEPRRSGGTAELADPDVPDVRGVPSVPDVPDAPEVPEAARGPGRDLRGPAVALGVGVLVVAVAIGAMFALGDGEARSPAPAASPRVAEARPTAAPPAPGTPTAAAGAPSAGAPSPGPGGLRGDGVTYEVVQRDSGYYEGTFVLTNRTGRPMTSWRLSFLVPGGDVRNVWGGRLVQSGEPVVIENAPGAAAVPPGGTVTVRFGAAGTPAAPAECVLNGAGCGL
ncbi:hypothetical protein GCM10010182_19550 [Actinomadura cremea]|nr:hypothetical protein GCM10010182_19550 [Actinomadura cremea]